METTPARDGAQLSAEPVVPCAQLSTGQPPAGGLPSGRTTRPDTATGSPWRLRER